VLHKITLNNKETDEKPYNFKQKKFYFIFTLRIYIGNGYKYKIIEFTQVVAQLHHSDESWFRALLRHLDVRPPLVYPMHDQRPIVLLIYDIIFIQ
jgi:hypothetical protein